MLIIRRACLLPEIMPTAAVHVLEDDGTLMCNAITCYKLHGPAAEAFQDCARQHDVNQEAVTFLANVWHEALSSKHVGRLSTDERFLLLLEVGTARLELPKVYGRTEAQQNAIMTCLRQELTVAGLSPDLQALGECCIDIYKAVFIAIRSHEVAVQVRTDVKALCLFNYSSIFLFPTVCWLRTSRSSAPCV